LFKKKFNFERFTSLWSYCRFAFGQHLQSLGKKTTSVNFWIMLLSDACCVLFSYMLAYSLRFEAFLLHERQLYYAGSMVLVFGVKLPVFYIMGLYNGMWRYTGLRDLQNIVKAILLSSATIISIMLLINRFQGFSRAVFIMDAIICLLLLCATRISIRYFLQHTRSRQTQRKKGKKRLLLIGAGDAAEKTVREIIDNQRLPYEVVGFVDDDATKIGRRIHGIPVIGTTEVLAELAYQTRAEELLIAIVALSGPRMKHIVAMCKQTGLPFKVLPGFGELIDGKLSISAIREIAYNDLLGREQVHLDQDQIGSYIRGKTLLVTGAGGSIGSELCRQLLQFSPGLLVLFDASEENLYTIQMQLEHEYLYKNYVTVLGQVQNEHLLERVFSQYSPHVVFHAAAYKHVPLIEINPWEAIFNNVVALQKLMEAAAAHKAERFVLVSTDKAVRPTNVMGASKRLTELIMLAQFRKQNALKTETEERLHFHHSLRMACMAVRFGNVLGSSGSVIPLFIRQIKKGGPVTVTHPDITRYFMSIEEAAQLILQAGAMGENGEIFILRMGQPVKIADLARELISLMGFDPDADIQIVYTGLRPGEKLYEELISEGEGIVKTGHDKIMVLKGTQLLDDRFEQLLGQLLQAAKEYNANGIKLALQSLIAEYTPDCQTSAVFTADRIAKVSTIQNEPSQREKV
jgi:FlaA1/EpsC-like NDP-sugar epimerase